MAYTPQGFEAALRAEGITGPLADLARSIFVQESGAGKNTQTSHANAVGGMQIIPGTFAQVADQGWDIHNPEHNMRAGIRYLKYLDGLSGGVPELTAAGYYGGPGGMQKAKKGIAVSDPKAKHAPNTLEYAQQVVSRLPKHQAEPVPQPVAASPDPRRVPEWQAMQQAVPEPITPQTLAYAQPQPSIAQPAQPVPEPVFQPQHQPWQFPTQALPPREVDFSAFRAWGTNLGRMA